MATSPTSQMIQHLRLVLLQDQAGPTDGQLLGRFIERRDEAAFAALVKRHGPMVWNVCRRLLNQHDAEDAFQATFLVLCRKAASIRRRDMVPSWLHGVAHQTALQARRAIGSAGDANCVPHPFDGRLAVGAASHPTRRVAVGTAAQREGLALQIFWRLDPRLLANEQLATEIAIDVAHYQRLALIVTK